MIHKIKNHPFDMLRTRISNLKNKVKGFTLIELLIVIAIIGVLSALLMANFIGVRQRARDGQRKADLRQVQSALELYRSDNSSYPSATEGALSTVLNNCSGRFGNSPTCTSIYLQKIPSDPTNSSPYLYTYSSGGTIYTLRACLENSSDKQADNPQQSCSGAPASFTLANP